MSCQGDLFSEARIALRHTIVPLEAGLALKLGTLLRGLSVAKKFSTAQFEGRPLLLQLPYLFTLLNFPEGTLFNRARTAFMIKAKRAFDMQWNLL